MNNTAIFRISGVAALGGLLFGFDTAIISGAIPAITAFFHLGATSLGFSVSAVLIGCALGAIAAGPLSNRFGRKAVLLICAMFFAASGVGAAISESLGVFVLFRIIGGLGVGTAAMVSPMYIAEMAPPSKRGSLVSLYQLAIVTGILSAYFVGYALDGTGENGWRWMFAAQVMPSLLFFGLLFAVPETPRWLLSKGRDAEALTVLRRIDFDNAIPELEEIQANFASHDEVPLSHPIYRRALIAGACLAIFQQVSGINAILYYAPLIFAQSGLARSGALLQTVAIGVVNVLAAIAAIALTDRLGRRKLLLSGSILMGLCLLSLAACFKFAYLNSAVVLILLIVYVGAFGCTLGAVTWVYLSEMFPNRIRGRALSLVTLALWFSDWMVAVSFPIIKDHWGTAATLLLYAICCAMAFIFIYRFLPETRGRSLEALEQLFTDHDKARIL